MIKLEATSSMTMPTPLSPNRVFQSARGVSRLAVRTWTSRIEKQRSELGLLSSGMSCYSNRRLAGRGILVVERNFEASTLASVVIPAWRPSNA
jgi:hypothetical protein